MPWICIEGVIMTPSHPLTSRLHLPPPALGQSADAGNAGLPRWCSLCTRPAAELGHWRARCQKETPDGGSQWEGWGDGTLGTAGSRDQPGLTPRCPCSLENYWNAGQGKWVREARTQDGEDEYWVSKKRRWDLEIIILSEGSQREKDN